MVGPLLCKGFTFAIFQSYGKTPERKDKLIMNAKGCAMTNAESLSIPGGRSSNPVDLFLLSFFRCVVTSRVET